MNEEKEKIDTKKQRKYESHHSPKKTEYGMNIK